MLPYIYSLAWMTTSESYTPMRPLVMDFRTDVRAQNIGDQFMYGPAFLVNPVTEPGATTRRLYLPQSEVVRLLDRDQPSPERKPSTPARRSIACRFMSAPDRFFRSARMIEWATEKPADPIELRIYRGADGDFTLYEDENDNLRLRKRRLRDHPSALG